MSWTRSDGFALVVLLLAVAAVYGRVVGFEFLGHGDPEVVAPALDPARGPDPATVQEAFTSFDRGAYQPLTRLSHALDLRLFGPRAGAHHATNLLLHAANALLAWWTLRRVLRSRGRALVIALLFALHPLQVQTVAWVSERQGLLAVFFGWLALDRYHAAVRSTRRTDVVLAHLCFAASLVSKPVLAPLPLALLAWDRWPLGRTQPLRALLVEKTAAFVLAAGAGVVAWIAQARVAGLAGLDEVGLGPRVLNAAVAYGRTLRRLFWPDDLAALHAFRFDVPKVEAAAAGIALLVLFYVAWRARARWPFLWTGLVVWALLQLPTVQLVQFGQESTADRFSHFPVVGLLVAVVCAAARVLPARLAPVAAVIAISACGIHSARTLSYWHDTARLFERNLVVTGGSAPIHLQLAQTYRDQGDAGRALSHANEALRYAPHSARVIFLVADLLYELGNYVAAHDRYAEGLRIAPGHPDAYARIGELLLARGDLEEAGRSFHHGMQAAPNDVRMVVGMAAVMQALGRGADQLALLQRALEIDPQRPGLRREIAWLAMTGTIDSAPSPESALRLAQVEWESSGRTDPLALEAMAAALARGGRVDEAAKTAREAEDLARSSGREDLAVAIAARRAMYLR